jgi:outer membrane protein assembly factor BamB
MRLYTEKELKMRERRNIFFWIFIGFVIGCVAISCSGNLMAETADEHPAPAPDDNWPQFRGYRAAGIASDQDLPLTWNVKKGTNILWKTAIPGLGHSSPVVWEDKVFVTTAEGEGRKAYLKVGYYGSSPDNPEKFTHHYRLYCLDKKTGKIIWEKTVYSGLPKVARHVKSSHANCTPATDGQHVLAFFGSQGLYCFDMDGNQLWEKDLGYLDAGAFDVPEIQWGFGSSPIIHEDKVVVLCDVNNQSFIAQLDIESGEEVWRTLRDEQPTWGTPTICEANDRTHILVNGFKHMGSYDFETGGKIWWMKGGGDIPVPTPVTAHGLVFITNSHGRMRPVYAIRLDAQGDISLKPGETSNEFIPWFYPRNGAYQPTPLVYGEYLYICENNGVLTCYEARTGQVMFREKIGGEMSSYSASPVAADGSIYFSDEYGHIHVIKASPQYEHLAVNPMEETCMASPAISGKTLFIRTRSYLYAVGKKDTAGSFF